MDDEKTLYVSGRSKATEMVSTRLKMIENIGKSFWNGLHPKILGSQNYIFILSGHAVFKCQCQTLISSIDNIISTNFLTSEGAGALVDKIFNADFCSIQKVENHFIRKAICIKCRRKIGHSIEMSFTNPKLEGKILLNMSNLKMTKGV